MANWTITDEEFERQYKEALKRGKESMKRNPRILSARYVDEKDRIVLELSNGITIMFPPGLVKELRRCSSETLSNIEILPGGFALRWPIIDADYSLVGLLMSFSGQTKKWTSEFARMIGSKTSEAKAAAARENGRKGGRPRKKAS